MSGLGDKWAEWRPSKAALFWSCAGCIVATMIVGFTWGGWTTGGSAREMADDAASAAREQLAAAVCVERFMGSPDAGTQLAALKDLSSYRRSSFIRDGSWAVMPGKDSAGYDVANECADQLAALEVPASTAAAAETTAVQ
jgi:hypothetical protein